MYHSAASLDEIKQWLKGLPPYKENAILEFIYELATRPEREWLEKERERIWKDFELYLDSGLSSEIDRETLKGIIWKN